MQTVNPNHEPLIKVSNFRSSRVVHGWGQSPLVVSEVEGDMRLLTLDLDGAQFPVLHGKVLEGAV